jgi:hypothetical protein
MTRSGLVEREPAVDDRRGRSERARPIGLKTRVFDHTMHRMMATLQYYTQQTLA